ncbi:MAG: T9SS type A sorting domain-containing protein [Bacteroidales bacterium]|nr:T9SS type A sorting domain-containing protein [Bacteroidales bacterium]
MGDIFVTQVINENVAYALSRSTGGGVLYNMFMKTINGGITWEYIFGGDAFHFLNSDIGYVVVNDINTVVYKTIDGGNNWIELETGFDFDPEVIRFYDNNNGIIANYNNIIKTNDAGESWEYCAGVSIGHYTDIEYRTADLVFAVGDGNNGIAKSTDGGLNWEMIFIDDFYGADDIFFLNDDIAFLASHNTILKSMDGGETWAPVIVNTENYIKFRSIHFPTLEIGYAVGDGDYENMFKTTDGGNNWNPITTNVSSDLNYVYFSEKDNGLAFGDGGVLIKTTTGGVVAIEEQANIAKNSFFDVFPNPTSDMINIQFNSSKKHENASILVKDAMGKTLETYMLENSQSTIQLSMESYSSGIYFLQYVSGEGVVDVKKVIVK